MNSYNTVSFEFNTMFFNSYPLNECTLSFLSYIWYCYRSVFLILIVVDTNNSDWNLL